MPKARFLSTRGSHVPVCRLSVDSQTILAPPSLRRDVPNGSSSHLDLARRIVS